jgi:hypothetical protein
MFIRVAELRKEKSFRSEILMVRLLGEQANQLARFTAFTHDEKQEAIEKLFFFLFISRAPGLSENVTRRLENSIDYRLLSGWRCDERH